MSRVVLHAAKDVAEAAGHLGGALAGTAGEEEQRVGSARRPLSAGSTTMLQVDGAALPASRSSNTESVPQ